MTFKFVYFVEMNWLQKYREDYSATIKIGVPIVLGQLGIVVVGLVDNIMVGHFSPVRDGIFLWLDAFGRTILRAR